MTQKVSEWLGWLGSHDIYDAKAIGEDFKDKTGQEPCWHVWSAKEVRQAIKKRGLGGNFHGNAPAVAGFEIAEALAMKFADFRSPCMGRGSIFSDCVEAIKKAEL